MTCEEAVEWLKGNRSTVNIISSSPSDTWEERIIRADNDMILRAYYVLKAHKENLV